MLISFSNTLSTILAWIVLGFGFISSTWAEEALSQQLPSLRTSIARGGQIYDDWSIALKKELPQSRHPSYPKTAPLEGGITWLCSTCHGWDYKGNSGINGPGSSHFTDIPGIYKSQKNTEDFVRTTLRNSIHGYTNDQIPDWAIPELSDFIRLGLLDMDLVIHRNSREAHGTANKGAFFFHGLCSRCHGVDGRFMTHSSKQARMLGISARKNPWKALHKIRNGQPSGIMPSFTSLLALKDHLDILAYVQTLPEK